VLDISDPVNLTAVGNYSTSGIASGIALSGDYAQLANESGGLHILDISDPFLPAFLDSFATAEDATQVAVAGDHAFVVGRMGIQIIDFLQDDVADAAANVGQSLAVGDASETITHVRFMSYETAGIVWELSADSGANFQSVTSNGAWLPFDTTGDQLLWRSTLSWSPGQNFSVSDLAIEWLTEVVPIISATDVADDQGGLVDLGFMRSGYDFPGETEFPIVGYAIYRRVDDPGLLKDISVTGSAPALDRLNGTHLASYGAEQVRILADRAFVLGGQKSAPGTFPPGVWEDVGWVLPEQNHSYIDRVHTAADSTSSGMTWSVFITATHTTTPSVWFASQPDSGYSIDNIPPGVPQNLVAVYTPGGISLDWDDAAEPDFQYHRIYRSTAPGFIPAPENLVHETASSVWTDPLPEPMNYYYKVTTLDYAGNESEAAVIQDVSGVGDSVVPIRTTLLAAYPNPFNPSTKLSFELASPAHARLSIFDAAGRLVTTLVNDQRGAGRHEIVWNGQNVAGQSVASGVYLYRFEAGDVVQTKRMMLLK